MSQLSSSLFLLSLCFSHNHYSLSSSVDCVPYLFLSHMSCIPLFCSLIHSLSWLSCFLFSFFVSVTSLFCPSVLCLSFSLSLALSAAETGDQCSGSGRGAVLYPPPNCRIREVHCGNQVRLVVVAIRDITKGEEITVDYNPSEWGETAMTRVRLEIVAGITLRVEFY